MNTREMMEETKKQKEEEFLKKMEEHKKRLDFYAAPILSALIIRATGNVSDNNYSVPEMIELVTQAKHIALLAMHKIDFVIEKEIALDKAERKENA